MSRVENYIEMLKEFDYLKNGKEATILFLEQMIDFFDDTFEYEWKKYEESVK